MSLAIDKAQEEASKSDIGRFFNVAKIAMSTKTAKSSDEPPTYRCSRSKNDEFVTSEVEVASDNQNILIIRLSKNHHLEIYIS